MFHFLVLLFLYCYWCMYDEDEGFVFALVRLICVLIDISRFICVPRGV